MIKFFKKNHIIKFKCNPELKGVIPEPIPASNATPKWFRKMNNSYAPMRDTVKKCIPFKDAMDMGYIIPLWVDFNIANDGNTISFYYKDSQVLGFNPLENHNPNQIEGCPISHTTYGNQPMKFISPWVIITPPGWSCMFIQPINHFDKRLHIITGVVDTDKYHNNVNFPFVWMDKEFNGVIPQGTPLVQVIPFKRTEWAYGVDVLSEKDIKNKNTIYAKTMAVFKNAYRLNWWSPKRYK